MPTISWIGDIDRFFEQTEINVAALCDALREFGAPEHLIDPTFLMTPNAVTQIGLAPVRIDLLAAITGVTFAEAHAGAETVELENERLLVIGLEDLRRNKRATGRTKDKDDLRRLSAAARRRPAK